MGGGGAQDKDSVRTHQSAEEKYVRNRMSAVTVLNTLDRGDRLVDSILRGRKTFS